MKNWTRYLFVMPAFLLFFTGCGALSLMELESEVLSNSTTDGKQSGKTNVEMSYEAENAGTFAYNQLSEAERFWYDDINRMLAMGDLDGTELSKQGLKAGLTEGDIDKIYQCVLTDHPEYFFVEGYEYVLYTADDELVGIDIKASVSLSEEEILERKQEIEAVVEMWLADAPMNGSDYEKIKYVYETIIYNTEYDMNATDNQNIYSVFAGQASVCQGYAKATQYLLQRMGVECTLVLGEVSSGEGHSWNLVKADGAYYYLDTTWGDASYFSVSGDEELKQNPDISYDYLCVTTEQLFKTHRVTGELEVPICKAMDSNYYVKEGCFFVSYDIGQIEREFHEAEEEGRNFVTIKCSSEDVYWNIYEKMIEEQEIFDYMPDLYDSVMYIENEQQLSLTFWMTN